MTHEDQTEFYTCPICGAGIGNDIDGAIEHDCPLEEQYVKDMTHTDSVETAAHNIVAHILGTTNWEADTTFIEDEIRTTLHQELQKAREDSGKRNAVVKEYKDEDVMFILKVEDGKTYEASMPIPKWVEVGKLTLRDQSELDQTNK
jgi:hypothetical protein